MSFLTKCSSSREKTEFSKGSSNVRLLNDLDFVLSFTQDARVYLRGSNALKRPMLKWLIKGLVVDVISCLDMRTDIECIVVS